MRIMRIGLSANYSLGCDELAVERDLLKLYFANLVRTLRAYIGLRCRRYAAFNRALWGCSAQEEIECVVDLPPMRKLSVDDDARMKLG